LIISKEAQAPELVKQLIQRARTEFADEAVKQGIIELLDSVLVKKAGKKVRKKVKQDYCCGFCLSDLGSWAIATPKTSINLHLHN
jgi:predicted transposase YdaD